MKRLPLTISIMLLLCCYANAQSVVDRGLVHDGMYINPGFGFSYNYPKNWVVHGDATNERLRELGKEKVAESGTSKAAVEVALNHTYHLLTVFRQPLGTPGLDFNPAILVIAEKVDYAPGITSGKDYLLNIRALMMKAGAHHVLLNEPMEYQVAGSQFYRDSYAVEINGVQRAEAYFAKVVNGYALVFIFIGEDQKSLDEMTKTMETFVPTPPVRRGVTTVLGSAPQRKPK